VKFGSGGEQCPPPTGLSITLLEEYKMKNLFVSTVVVAVVAILGLIVGGTMEAVDSSNCFMVGNNVAITIHNVALFIGTKGLVVAAVMLAVSVVVSMTRTTEVATTTAKTKVYRYMSKKELEMIMNGETVVGQLQDDVASATGTANRSNVCFLGEVTKFRAVGEDHAYSAVECYTFLEGIVSDEVLVEFETDITLEKGFGRYASPYGMGSASIFIDEYYVPEYSSKDFKVVRYGTPDYYKDFTWNN
jgi:hypothetical protein